MAGIQALKGKLYLGLAAAVAATVISLSAKIAFDSQTIKLLDSKLAMANANLEISQNSNALLREEIADQNLKIDAWKKKSLDIERRAEEAGRVAAIAINDMKQEVQRLKNRPVGSCEEQATEAIEWIEHLRQ